jgi:hypothetical protein
LHDICLKEDGSPYLQKRGEGCEWARGQLSLERQRAQKAVNGEIRWGKKGTEWDKIIFSHVDRTSAGSSRNGLPYTTMKREEIP